jgi:hypothetical protein
MKAAVTTAQQLLHTADTRLSAYLSADPKSPASNATGLSMLRHFAASDARTARYVQGMVRRIADRLRTGGPKRLHTSCHGAADSMCTVASAYVDGGKLVICPSFSSDGPGERPGTMIHEIAHSLLPAGPMHITDRSAPDERLYERLSVGEALTNAASYEMFIRELGTGKAQQTGPEHRDTYENNCPKEWRIALNAATALAERWNRDAQVVVHDQDPAFLAAWKKLAKKHLGGQTKAQVSGAAAVYDGAASRLAGKVDFACDPKGGGSCDASGTYSDASRHFHVCHSWWQATDVERTKSLLAGLYGHFGLVDDPVRRSNLAELAQELHEKFWKRPSNADVSKALTKAEAGKPPPPAPLSGP